MQLIETTTAPNPRRVRIFLAEKGIKLPTLNRPLDSLNDPDFVALNPQRRVPILVLDDGTVIAETIAICRYFEALQPEPSLMGRTPVEVGVIEMWQRRVELGFFHFVATAFRHKHPSMAKMEVPQIEAWGDANKDKAIHALSAIDAQLAKHSFLAGESFSVADITLGVAVSFMKPARVARPEGLVHLERWLEIVGTRPSVHA